MRKASPPITETTIVVTITTRPSVSERLNEPQMSPTACSSNRSKNQCSEAPFIGKVSPPLGPWKLRMPMVTIGP